MPEEPIGPEDPINRRQVSVRRVVFLLALLLVVAAVIVVAVVLTGPDDDSRPGGADGTDSGLTGVTSPYDFSELPDQKGPGEVERASYVSIMLVDAAGSLTSYGANATLPAAKALLDAVRSSDEVDDATAAALGQNAQGTANGATASTLTFVFPDRSTLTYTLYLNEGLIARGSRAWEPQGDLPKLVQAIVAAGQPQTPETQ